MTVYAVPSVPARAVPAITIRAALLQGDFNPTSILIIGGSINGTVAIIPAIVHKTQSID